MKTGQLAACQQVNCCNIAITLIVILSRDGRTLLRWEALGRTRVLWWGFARESVYIEIVGSLSYVKWDSVATGAYYFAYT